MIKPVRLLSLGVCAAIGGAAAFVIATQKIDGEILPESPPPQGIALESEPRPQVERAPATPIQDTDVFTAPSDELPSFEPRMASATDDDLTFNERASGFAAAMAPVDEPPLVPVPDTQAVAAANYVVQNDHWNETPNNSSNYITDSVDTTYAIPEMAATQPVVQSTNAVVVDSESENEENTQLYVVRDPHNAEPVFTLRLGRTESSRIATEDKGFVSKSQSARRRIVPAESPQASLFVDVDEHDLICTIDAQHFQLRDLLTLVAERAGIPIHSTQHVRGLVSAHIKNVRLEDAIQQIIMPLGFSVGVNGNALIVGLHNEVRGFDQRLNGFDDMGRNGIAGRPQAVRLVGHHGDVATTGDVAQTVWAEDEKPLPLHAISRSAVPAESSPTVPTESSPTVPTATSPRRLPEVDDGKSPVRAASDSDETKVFTVIAERALTMMQEGHYRKTVEMLSQLVSDHGQSAQLFALLGEAYYHCDEYRAAEISLIRSLELYRNDARTNYFMGCTFRALGNRQRGQHYLLQAHHLDPMYPPVVNAQALAPR
jgi:hypothetical protein